VDCWQRCDVSIGSDFLGPANVLVAGACALLPPLPLPDAMPICRRFAPRPSAISGAAASSAGLPSPPPAHDLFAAAIDLHC